MKIYAATAALIALASPTIALASYVPSPFFIETANIEKITCGGGTGTGARIDANTIITVAHVAGIGGCSNDGIPLTVAYSAPEMDFAVFTTNNASPTAFTISCKPIVPGATYLAAGYAFGGELTIQRYVGTDRRHPMNQGQWSGMAKFRGRGYSGMSGGPVLDSDGNIVGVHSGTHRLVSLASVRLLADTYLCASKSSTAT